MSTEPTTEMMNVVMARFEGRKFFGKYSIDDYGPNHCLTYPEMKYHTSLDWLWPVWVKFRALSFTEKFRRWNHERHKESIAKSLCDGTIEEVHRYLYRGVVWYQKVNQQKQNNE